MRSGLNLAGLAIFLTAAGLGRPGPAEAAVCLLCFVVSEIMGRMQFYRDYRRIGL